MELSEAFWTTFANGLAGAVGGVFGALLTLWIQSRKERITRIDEETLRVEYSAIKRDKEGYYIPGYGRIISLKNDQNLEEMDEVKKWGKNIAFLCVNRTAAASEVPHTF